MGEHIKALGVVSLLRSIVEILLGSYLIAVINRWSHPASNHNSSFHEEESWLVGLERWWANHFATLHPNATPEPGDWWFLLVLGLLFVLFGLFRLVQSSGSLLAFGWARKLGLVLAAFDFVTPITLPLAFWSFVVYRHHDTRDYFSRREVSQGAG